MIDWILVQKRPPHKFCRRRCSPIKVDSESGQDWESAASRSGPKSRRAGTLLKLWHEEASSALPSLKRNKAPAPQRRPVFKRPLRGRVLLDRLTRALDIFACPMDSVAAHRTND